MKTVKVFLIALCAACLYEACGSEEAPEAFKGEEPVLGDHSLPQGNHDYDQTIMDWNRRYNILPLYRFDEKDWYWGVTQDLRIYYDEYNDRDHGGYLVEPADEAYVGQQLQLIADCVWHYFPDSLLREVLPMKLLLASDIQHDPASLKGRVPESQYTHENTLAGYDYVAFSGGTAHITEMTQAERQQYKTDGIMLVFSYGIDNGKIPVPESFAAISDYTAEYSSATAAYMAGLLTQYGSAPAYDLKQYIRLIVTTSQQRITTQYLNLYPLIKQKYDIIEDYFKEEYGIDLQSIGDGN